MYSIQWPQCWLLRILASTFLPRGPCRSRAPLGLRATRVRMPLWHDSFPCEICDMTHSHVRHDSFGVVFALLLVFAPLASVCPCVRETWLIHTWDMTHSHVRHALCTRETWRIHTCDMPHSHVRRDLFGVVFVHLFAPLASVCPCDMTHSHVRFAIWLIPMWDMTHLVSSLCTSSRHSRP